jgi:hypothetical protein
MNNHICSTCSEGVSICEQQQYHQGNRVRHLSWTSPSTDECLATVIVDFSGTRPSPHYCPTRQSYEIKERIELFKWFAFFIHRLMSQSRFVTCRVLMYCEDGRKQRFTPIRLFFTCHPAFSNVCSASSYMMKQTKQTKLNSNSCIITYVKF